MFTYICMDAILPCACIVGISDIDLHDAYVHVQEYVHYVCIYTYTHILYSRLCTMHINACMHAYIHTYTVTHVCADTEHRPAGKNHSSWSSSKARRRSLPWPCCFTQTWMLRTELLVLLRARQASPKNGEVILAHPSHRLIRLPPHGSSLAFLLCHELLPRQEAGTSTGEEAMDRCFLEKEGVLWKTLQFPA
jgi:hypothetical protein